MAQAGIASLVEWCRTERGWEGRVISVLWVDAAESDTLKRMRMDASRCPCALR